MYPIGFNFIINGRMEELELVFKFDKKKFRDQDHPTFPVETG